MKRTATILVYSLLTAALAFCLFAGLPQALSMAKAAALPATAVNVGPRAQVGGADPANGIYVSPSGNDASANGSISAPYKSINSALAAASAGSAIILRGGTYREGVNVRVRTPNITIKSHEGEWAIIDLTTYDSGHDEDSGVYFDVESSGGKLQSVEVMGGFYAVCMETMWDWGQADRSGASNIIIEDCVLHDSYNDTVKVKPNCNNIIIRCNEIYNSGRSYAGRADFDTGECNSEGIDNVNGANMLVQNNYIHDICSTAVYAKGGATDAVIENNLVERAYGAGIMVGFDTSPEYFDHVQNPKYYENIRGIVRNNLIIDAGWEGIGLYASQDAQVYNNTIINAVGYGRGLYHSPIYYGVATQDWDNPSGCPPNINPNIHHNIVVQPATYNDRMIDIRYAGDVYSFGLAGLDGQPTMSNNCYYVAGKKAGFSDNRPRSLLDNASLAAWQTHIGGDSGSLESDPALGADYLPTNPQCAGMGITQPLTVAAATTTLPSTSPSMTNFIKAKTYTSGQFNDVTESMWYGFNGQKVIASAYEYGLMQGAGTAIFNPEGNMTVAEAITIAARIHSIYTTGTERFVQGSPWYQVYVDYAVKNGIIAAADFSNYTKAISRAEMAYIFANALPAAELATQNTVTALPDVNSATSYEEEIIMLYQAGVLTGSDDKGTFNPQSNISRAEAAAIITRVILPDARGSGKTFE